MGAASSPRIRDLPSGTRAVEFTLATSHPSHNEEKKALRYHKIKSYNNTIADLVGENLGNDNRVDVYVEGSLATRRYLDKNGEKRYETFVYGDKVVFLAPRMSEAYESTPQQEEEPTPEGW
ncbi:hypothetical protein K7432_018173 [Basidiobolus ranarum]|uniref:Single-stranded DNA-binding protein n=1 Tax=Basidiobolus ranarum TaxID=34480 RepID=A0ABR2VJE9_9FUNG